MADTKLRIHQLAKELNVKSKAIIDKCAAEGIEIKNHMHPVSAGLEATIREWFSDGMHATTLEESDRVDLTSTKIKRKPRKRTAAGSTDDQSAVATLEAPESAQDEMISTPVEAPAPPPVRRPQIQEVTVEEETEAEAPAPMPASVEIAAEAPSRSRKTEPPPAQPEVQPPPPVEQETTEQIVKIAGPQNIPKPAQLSGPRVVRMGTPEYVEVPRSAPRPSRPPLGRGRTDEEESEDASGSKGKGGRPKPRVPGRPPAAAPAADRRSVHPRRSFRDTREEATEMEKEWRDRDLIERRDRLAHASGRGIGGLRAIEGKLSARRGGVRIAPRLLVKKSRVELTEPIIIKNFSRETGIPVGEILQKLRNEHGLLTTMLGRLPGDVAELIAAEYGIELVVQEAKTGLDRLADEHAALPRKHLMQRPPVVTVLGHVDHGKTSLLDRIRKAKVAAGEAGGITQHIGAYQVRLGEKAVTFLDTPGHAAFTAMRARGASMTDVVVLVVAADDGVMPTTVEAINHARAAKTPIVVALNKIDLPHDINQLYGQLAQHDLTPSGDWGGQTDVIHTSATSGLGIDELLAHLATLGEIMELKADPDIPAAGAVIEAERSEALGNVARILVQEGTLKIGDYMVCGAAHGRVRTMTDDKGRKLKKAGPSTPVEVTGLSAVPLAGDRFFGVESATRAKQIAEEVAIVRREQELVRTTKPTNLESLLAHRTEGEIPELRVIVRADVQGSVDVLKKTLSEFPADQVKLQVLHAGVGSVTESDVVLAAASDAIIVAFHVTPDSAAARRADQEGVDIRTYQVIYHLLDDIRLALEGLLTPEEKQETRGTVEVREVYNISRIGRIAGCYVRDGLVNRNHRVRVIRNGVIVKDNAGISSLRRFKDDVKEVKSGFECGLRIENFDDLKPGDVIESFETMQIAQTLNM